MSADGWEQVKEVLHRAMQLPPEQRAGFLDRACSGEEALRAEVESLLAADSQMMPSFLGSMPAPLPATERARGAAHAADLEPGLPFEQRFVLIRKLGEGGMGQVWLAEQTTPVKRQVALKLIKAGMYDEEVVQRFRAERQSLAIMDHPSIAKVFDAGATPQGQPYFVMEYVSGLPLTEYCDRHSLTIPARLELFMRVCAAVQHAHQKAILHRDLKPANILVAEMDGRPVPRIIDFGLAKATQSPVGGESFVTQLGQFMGTPGYMSPEQAAAQDIDTRMDVYALGVVLYEMLVRVRPFDDTEEGPPPLGELLRCLREDDPPVPSVKLDLMRDAAEEIASAHGVNRKQLIGLLRGDLDGIALKALAREREKRYGSPAELAADLHRYLSHEPVMARPAGTAYRLRKYARRHRVGVSVGVGLAAVVVTVAVLQTFNVNRLTRERDRVERERSRAVHVTDLMTGMFKLDKSGAPRGNTITAREVLDHAVAETRSDLADDPDAQAQMMHLIARAYLNLGLLGQAHLTAQNALDTRLKLHGPDDARTLESMAQVGWILGYEGQREEALRLEREALARERRVLGPLNALTRETQHKLSIIDANPAAPLPIAPDPN